MSAYSLWRLCDRCEAGGSGRASQSGRRSHAIVAASILRRCGELACDVVPPTLDDDQSSPPHRYGFDLTGRDQRPRRRDPDSGNLRRKQRDRPR